MREIDRFVSMLFPKDDGLIDLKFFPGEQPVTVEEFCKEMHSAFLQVESGQSDAHSHFGEESKRISVDRFLTGG